MLIDTRSLDATGRVCGSGGVAGSVLDTYQTGTNKHGYKLLDTRSLVVGKVGGRHLYSNAQTVNPTQYVEIEATLND